jgi:hypothetical protein
MFTKTYAATDASNLVRSITPSPAALLYLARTSSGPRSRVRRFK